MSDPTPNEHITAANPYGSSHAITPAAADHHAPTAEAFSDSEWANLQADDFAAGRAVVALILGIFLTGVVLYTIVAYFVIS